MILRSMFFCLCFLLFSFTEAKILLDKEEAAVLQQFIYTLFNESEAGFVLYGKKPVCIHGFYNHDPFFVNSEIHKQSVALKEGARIWDKFCCEESDVIVRIAKQEDPHIKGYSHVLVINKPSLESVLQNNLVLFQYVLGPSVSPQTLLEAITAPDSKYYSLLQQNKVLIGDILGFGLQNALWVSRIENIQEQHNSIKVPFLNSKCIKQQYPNEYLPFMLGFGFNSTEDEMAVLESKIDIPSKKLVEEKPQFIFGCVKDSKDNQKLIVELEDTQMQIQQLISSSDFLERVLARLTLKEYDIALDDAFHFEITGCDQNLVVAKCIWETLQDYDTAFLSSFLEGFKWRKVPNIEIEPFAFMPAYLREIRESKFNLQHADCYFQELAEQGDIQLLIPNKLCCKILKEGGEKQCLSPLVTIQYSVFSPLGQCLAHESNKLVNLNNTIAGFREGIKGMKVGETREIYIHPALTYEQAPSGTLGTLGLSEASRVNTSQNTHLTKNQILQFDTSLEKCIYLKAVVTLIDTCSSNDFFKPVEELDLSFLKNDCYLEAKSAAYKHALQAKGGMVAQHLSKCNSLDLNKISEYLLAFYTDPSNYAIPSTDERSLMNQIHWNIYFCSKSL